MKCLEILTDCIWFECNLIGAKHSPECILLCYFILFFICLNYSFIHSFILNAIIVDFIVTWAWCYVGATEP